MSQDEVLLGPEQLVVVGYGEYARAKYDLGVQEDVMIPKTIHQLDNQFRNDGTNAVLAIASAPVQGSLRIVMRQSARGLPVRTSAGAPPNGTSLGQIVRMDASQEGRSVPVHIQYDKEIWSGLSWAVGEIASADVRPGLPLRVRCFSREKKPVNLKVELYLVSYD